MIKEIRKVYWYNCCLFIFRVVKVSGDWIPDPVPLCEGGQLEARPVAAHAGVDAPGLLIDCEHVAVGACRRSGQQLCCTRDHGECFCEHQHLIIRGHQPENNTSCIRINTPSFICIFYLIL